MLLNLQLTLTEFLKLAYSTSVIKQVIICTPLSNRVVLNVYMQGKTYVYNFFVWSTGKRIFLLTRFLLSEMSYLPLCVWYGKREKKSQTFF